MHKYVDVNAQNRYIELMETIHAEITVTARAENAREINRVARAANMLPNTLLKNYVLEVIREREEKKQQAKKETTNE